MSSFTKFDHFRGEPALEDPLAESSEALAAVVASNHRVFKPGETISNPSIHARSLIGVLSGFGTIRINEESFEAQPRRLLVAPWRHEARYEAAEHQPMQVLTVHLIPRYDRAAEALRVGVAHRPHVPLARDPRRHDLPLTGYRRARELDEHAALLLMPLMRFAAERFRRGAVTEAEVRRLGMLFLQALALVRDAPDGRQLPDPLTRLVDRFRLTMAEAWDLGRLADATGMSTATLRRQFRRHLGDTPARWVLTQRIEAAAELLTTTDLPVHAVAEHVGIPDPYGFSRAFKRQMGVPPLAYRQRGGGGD